MYFIGIDISKFKHDCAIIDEAGDTVTASWSPPMLKKPNLCYFRIQCVQVNK